MHTTVRIAKPTDHRRARRAEHLGCRTLTQLVNLARAGFPATPAELLPDNDRILDALEVYFNPAPAPAPPLDPDTQAVLAGSIARSFGGPF